MTKRLAVLSTAMMLFSVTVSGITDDDVASALALFSYGQDVAVAWSDEGRAVLEAAIDVLETALGVDVLFDHADEGAYMTLDVAADRKTWVNALSQAYYTWGDVFLTDDAAKKGAFTRGQYWGLKSLRMSSDFAAEELRHGFVEAVEQESDVVALFWTYGNWSRKDEYDPLGAIARNDPPKLVALIERALEVDASYLAYGPYRALSAFWGGLPPFPLYAYGQNLPRALSYICPVINEPGYCSACGDCPASSDGDSYFENRLVFAEYYLMEKGLWDDAARVLQSILDDELGERFALYNAYCAKRAEELLREVLRRI